jgi:hypothetical protein
MSVKKNNKYKEELKEELKVKELINKYFEIKKMEHDELLRTYLTDRFFRDKYFEKKRDKLLRANLTDQYFRDDERDIDNLLNLSNYNPEIIESIFNYYMNTDEFGNYKCPTPQKIVDLFTRIHFKTDGNSLYNCFAEVFKLMSVARLDYYDYKDMIYSYMTSLLPNLTQLRKERATKKYVSNIQFEFVESIKSAFETRKTNTLEDYIKESKKDFIYGTTFEIFMISKKFNTNITVYNKSGDIITMTNVYNTLEETIQNSLIHLYYCGNNHFELLVPKYDQKTELNKIITIEIYNGRLAEISSDLYSIYDQTLDLLIKASIVNSDADSARVSELKPISEELRRIKQSRVYNTTATSKQVIPTVKDPELAHEFIESLKYEHAIANSFAEQPIVDNPELAQAMTNAKESELAQAMTKATYYEFPPPYIYNPLDPNEQPPSIKLPNPPGFFESIIRRFWSGGDLSKQNIDPYYLKYLKYKNKYIDLKNNTN